ncbi:hypothetical protein IZ6_07330 [Terrihabitans soli]|uniref:Uncharacterized protein n=1 Tax=Terrihabitans soli TaxID=708113 RepID=A0A6S6QU48_9HYPH|nr:hypothetical protein IZ6_07330 [Terrihabitans soli]
MKTRPPRLLPESPDPAILALARFLGRQAAREDHEAETGEKAFYEPPLRDIRPVLDRPSERTLG